MSFPQVSMRADSELAVSSNSSLGQSYRFNFELEMPFCACTLTLCPVITISVASGIHLEKLANLQAALFDCYDVLAFAMLLRHFHFVFVVVQSCYNEVCVATLPLK